MLSKEQRKRATFFMFALLSDERRNTSYRSSSSGESVCRISLHA